MVGAVFYFTQVQRERADEKFESVLQNYDERGIKCVKFIKLKEQMFAYFENGDLWKLLRYREDIRGHKMNIAYVPRDPDPVTLSLIKANTIWQPCGGVVYY